MTRIAINGLRRIGKLVLRGVVDGGLGGKIVLLTDPAGTPDQHAHLFVFDTVESRWGGHRSVSGQLGDLGDLCRPASNEFRFCGAPLAPLIPDPRLHQGRAGHDGRGVLRHVKRCWPAIGHAPFGNQPPPDRRVCSLPRNGRGRAARVSISRKRNRREVSPAPAPISFTSIRSSARCRDGAMCTMPSPALRHARGDPARGCRGYL